MFQIIFMISLIFLCLDCGFGVIISDCADVAAERLQPAFIELNATHDEQMYAVAHNTKNCVERLKARAHNNDYRIADYVDIPDYEHLVRLCGSDLECIFNYVKMTQLIQDTLGKKF